MVFPNAPQALSYGAPELSFAGLDQLGDKFFRGAEQRRQFDLSRAFQGGIPKKPDGSPDFDAMADVLARHGATDQVLPLSQEALERQQLAALQATTPYGPGGMPLQQGQGAPPPRILSPMPQGAPQPQGKMPPFPGSRPGANEGALSQGAEEGESLRTLATGLARGKDVGELIPRFSAGLKVNPDDPLTPEQEARIRPVLARSIAEWQQQQGRPSQVGPRQTAPTQAAPTPAPIQTPETALVPPGVDPRQEIARLRAAGQNILVYGGKRGERLAQEYFNRADRIESDAYGVQAEAKRQHGAAEMTPVTIGQGPFGEEIKAVKDLSSGGFRMIDPKTGQLVQGAAGTPAKESVIPAKDLELDRKAGRNVDYLQSLDPERQSIVRKIADYDMNPNSLSIKGGHRERVLDAVARFDPTYDQKNYNAFQEGLKKFQSGKEGAAVRAFNVGLEHIDQLLELGRALNNGDIPKINELKNWVKTNLGEDAPTNFNGLKAIVGAEIVKAIVGAGGTGEERAAAARTVAGASSMPQLEGIGKTYVSAMGAQIGGLQRQYEQSTGRKDFDRLLSPQALRARDSHNAASSGGTVPVAPPGTATIVNQKTGERMKLSPDGSKWVPVR